MKISKQKLKTIIKESFEKILNESDFDLERMGRERSKRMTPGDLSTGVDRIESVFSKYRSMYPGILEHDDIAFIDFIINTNKLVYRDDYDLLSAKRKDLMRSAERSKENDGTATRIGRMMFENNGVEQNLNINMNPSEQLTQFLKDREGLRLAQYLDTNGHPTIGYGHKIRSNENIVSPITEPEALQYLDADIERASDSIRRSSTDPASSNLTIPFELTQQQFDALTSVIFNTGPTGYSRSRLHREFISQGITSGDEFERAFERARAEGDRDLMDRRLLELALFRDGTY